MALNPETRVKPLTDALGAYAPLPLVEILQLGGGIARCLARLHATGQLHLDLCPAKVLWSQAGGQVEVELAAPQERGADNQLLGSIDPGFASPELLQNGAVDARSDLFSLGCVLYAMSTGHGPFWGATPADLARSVREAEPRPVGQLNPRLTAWLAAVIMKLLEKDPSRRFADAAQLSDMLLLQASMAGTIRRPPPRSVPEHPAAVRVPLGAVLASPATVPLPGTAETNGNGRHERADTVDPAALASEMATLADAPTGGFAPAAYRRWALLAGLCATPILIGLGLFWWWQSAASRDGDGNGMVWEQFVSIGGDQRAAANKPQVQSSTAAPSEAVSDGPIAFTQTTELGNKNGEEFEELSESLGPVIGFDITMFESGGHLVVKSIQTLYRSGQTKRVGATFGAPRGKVTRIEAKPGYAVGGIFVRASSRIDGIRVKFMRQTGRVLDLKDSYDSDWVGTAGKGGKLLGGNGRLVIGIHGRSSRDLDAIGLMQTVARPSDDSP